MLGKYKGFYVPGKDPARPKQTQRNPKIRFCRQSKMKDCESTGEKFADCSKCLFYNFSNGEQENAFEEWHQAKGKVAYA